jgi:hypothetical protein
VAIRHYAQSGTSASDLCPLNCGGPVNLRSGCAANAFFRHRIDLQPLVGNGLAAFGAKAILTIGKPPFRHLDPHQVASCGRAPAPAAICCCCIASMRESLPTDCWSSVTGARASSLISDMASSSRFFSSSRFACGLKIRFHPAIMDQPACRTKTNEAHRAANWRAAMLPSLL